MKATIRGTIGPALAAAVLGGCGAQDLYEPPVAPIEVVGRLALPTESQGVDVLGDHAYVAGGQAGLEIVDLSDPAHPTLVMTLDTVKYAESVRVASTASAAGVVDIAFVVEGTEGVTTYDVTHPEAAYSFNQGTTAVDGNGLFIELRDDPDEPFVVFLAESWKGLRIFEAEPTIPGLLRYEGVFCSTGGYARAVTVHDGYAYVADDEMGLAVVDVRDRTLGAVEKVSWCDTPGLARGVDMDFPYVYVADYDRGLAVFEIRDEGTPAVPTPFVVGGIELAGRCSALVVRDGVAYVAAGDGGVQVVDVSVPTAPVSLGRVTTSNCTGIALAPSGLVLASDTVEGLIVLDRGAAFSDRIAPAAVTDLVATGINSTTVRLAWTAPGDDRWSGTAAAYDVRWSLAPIGTEAEWDAATQAEGEPAPSPRGTAESWDVTGLTPGVAHWFALRTVDAAGNRSPRSNAATATPPSGNVPPVLSGGWADPAGGTDLTSFRWEVTYTDGDGDEPTEASVVVDGVAHAMTRISGTPGSGALYRWSASALEVGEHAYVFRFADGANPPVVTPAATGPWVGVYAYTMGSPPEEAGRDDDETAHLVVGTREFWISDHEVTQAEWTALMGANPSRFVGADRPVERVTWYDAIDYCNARSLDESRTPAYTVDGTNVTWDPDADGYRLPTEAEWEAACRAGTGTALPGGELVEEGCGIDPVLDAVGWYCGNAGAATHDVMQKTASPSARFDMHGNVQEWCWDVYTADLGEGLAVDPRGPGGGAQRTIRGGSWYYFARECRSASRAPYWPNSSDDTVGFRIARNIP